MTVEGTLSDALLAVHDVLDDAAVDHALAGGLAANLYRQEVRATTDVDLYVVVPAPQLVELTRLFEDRGWQVHPAWARAEQLRLDRSDLPRVDCLVASTPYEREAVRHAVTMTVAGREMKVLTPEDLMVFKLAAGRARDYEAVAAILNAQADALDVDYVRRRLESLEMADRWDRVVEEAEREAEDLG